MAMPSQMVIYRAIAFSAGSISALALAAVLGILGPKHRSERSAPIGQAIAPIPSAPPAAVPIARAEESPPAAPEPARERKIASRRDPPKKEKEKEKEKDDAHALEGALARALAKRGLTIEDLDLFPTTRMAKGRLASVQKQNDPHEVDAAMRALLHEVEGVRISADLPKRKLDSIAALLQDAKSTIPSDRFQRFETRYLDLGGELETTNGERGLLGLWVRISALEREVKAAQHRP
jgi:hypothetical protein